MHPTIFDYPAKTFIQGWFSCAAKKKHQGRIKAMSKVGGSTNFPVRYIDTFFILSQIYLALS